jgi:hypothetical protein
MTTRLAYLSIFLLLGTASGTGQIIIPGVGYPGGRRYPRGGPGGQPASGPANNASTLVGILRKIEDKDVIIESDDSSITTVLKTGSTKYENASGGKATIGDFQPGDHVRIAANQDSKKAYHAKTIAMVTEGTPEEHSAASAATEDTSRPIFAKPNVSSSGGNSSSGSSSNDNDPNRPVLRRAAPSLSRAPDSGSNNSSGSSASSASGNDDAPRLRRASSSGSDSAPASAAPATNAAPPPLYGNSDTSSSSDPPVLRRSGSPPASTPVYDGDTAGQGRPSLHSDSSNGSPRLPQGMPATQDEFIEQAREAAFAFSETLPNYIVKQYTTRYATGGGRGGRTSWQALDQVTADVIDENGTEQYKNILINGRPPVRDVERSGSWSKGEFSSLLQDLFSPRTNADFHNKRNATIVNRAAWEYAFTVEQPNSHWHVEVETGAYMPGYSGEVWIDKENHRVLRIEMSAERMPSSFPLDQVEWAVDYDYVPIGESRYLLPVHSETLSCERGTNQCSRNVIDFRNYRKFTADSSITFAPQ